MAQKIVAAYFVTPFGFGETPRFLCKTGDRFGERLTVDALPFSVSGEGSALVPVAEFLRDGVKRTVVSRWRNLIFNAFVFAQIRNEIF